MERFPPSRIATFDVYAVGHLKHHISVLLECDVTESRLKLSQLKAEGNKISFTAWLLKVIANTLKHYPEATSFLHQKRKLIIFEDIDISMMVEKSVDGKRIPIPLVIQKANEKSIIEIGDEINSAKKQDISKDDIVLGKKPKPHERLYQWLPGFLRRSIWKFLLRHPKIAYKSMGNVIITSVGMMGKVNGWFIHRSIHPISFGIGSILKKPGVVDDKIEIREILNMTILIDHDVIDGAPMARFVQELVKRIEHGSGL